MVDKYEFQVDGMHCGSCALLIDETLRDLLGVRDSHTNRRQGRATVELEPGGNAGDVRAAIAELGYRATLLESHHTG